MNYRIHTYDIFHTYRDRVVDHAAIHMADLAARQQPRRRRRRRQLRSAPPTTAPTRSPAGFDQPLVAGSS